MHIIPQLRETVGNLCVVSPDKGAAAWVGAIAREMGVEHVVFKKERYEKDKTRIVEQKGSCSYDTAIIVDDMITTGGTALNACRALKQTGIKRVYGIFVHPVLTENAQLLLQQDLFEHIFVSNTIPIPANISTTRLTVFDASDAISQTLTELIPHL